MSSRKLVFAGGGHAHLFSLGRVEELVDNGAEVLLIAPDEYHYYSGMGPGMLSRIYEPEDARFDVRRMVERGGGHFIRGRVVNVDPQNRTLYLDDGLHVPYDIVSFNVGSFIPSGMVVGAADEAYPVKPVEKLELLRKDILSRISHSTPRILVIGAGPAGVELSANIHRLISENGGRADIVLAGSGERILDAFPLRASIMARDSLVARGVRILDNSRIVSLSDGVAVMLNGYRLGYDVAVMTIGIKPVNVFGPSLEVDEQGALVVDRYLKSTSDDNVFGGGDCIFFRERPLVRAGVYAVRQGPVLFRNLKARLTGAGLTAFVPQEKYMLIFNLGDRSGILVRGGIVLKGRWAFLLKDIIDRHFMGRFQVR